MTNEQIIEKYCGCVIESIKQTHDNCVVVMFKNGKGLEFLDDGQRCYERRYMTIDDNLDE